MLYEQKPFSIHSSVDIQEGNRPKQNLQNLRDKGHFPRAQKLQNTTAQFITFLILIPESVFFCAKKQCIENPESIQLHIVWTQSRTPKKGST